MGAALWRGRVGGLAVALGTGAAVLAGASDAAADTAAQGGPDSATAAPISREAGPVTAARTAPKAVSQRRQANRVAASPAADSKKRPAAATRAPAGGTARADAAVSVDLPPMPVRNGLSFTVSNADITDVAEAYVAAGGDPDDSPQFFFGDLAVASLTELAEPAPSREDVRVQLGNLAVSGYFGGIWLRDNLTEAPAPEPAPPAEAGGLNLISRFGFRLFGGLAGLFTTWAQDSSPWVVTSLTNAFTPVLLGLYGYNRGYLEYLLDNPPPGVPSMKDTLTCTSFLACDSTAFPIELANRYDSALVSLADPPDTRWRTMATWTSLLENTTDVGEAVWRRIAPGGFSATSYVALVNLSSAYLMIGKATVLSGMLGYANDDAPTARNSLRLQGGLWMWSGTYFAGLASDAPAGTIPTIVVSQTEARRRRGS